MKFYSEYYNILIINCAKFHAAATFSFFVIKEGPRLIGRPSYLSVVFGKRKKSSNNSSRLAARDPVDNYSLTGT
jgi:hypothetical protein